MYTVQEYNAPFKKNGGRERKWTLPQVFYGNIGCNSVNEEIQCVSGPLHIKCWLNIDSTKKIGKLILKTYVYRMLIFNTSNIAIIVKFCNKFSGQKVYSRIAVQFGVFLINVQ